MYLHSNLSISGGWEANIKSGRRRGGEGEEKGRRRGGELQVVPSNMRLGRLLGYI